MVEKQLFKVVLMQKNVFCTIFQITYFQSVFFFKVMADWVFYWRRVEKERKRERKEEEEERMTGDKRGRIVEEKEKKSHQKQKQKTTSTILVNLLRDIFTFPVVKVKDSIIKIE